MTGSLRNKMNAVIIDYSSYKYVFQWTTSLDYKMRVTSASTAVESNFDVYLKVTALASISIGKARPRLPFPSSLLEIQHSRTCAEAQISAIKGI